LRHNSPSRSDALSALISEPRSLSIDDDGRAYLTSPCSTKWPEGEPAMNLLAKEPWRQEMGEPMKWRAYEAGLKEPASPGKEPSAMGWSWKE
jgi:hypothetical protein